jgi:opacity protein-like surface antigen
MKKLIFALIAGATATVLSGTAIAQSKPYVGIAAATSDHDMRIGGATNVDSDGYKPSAKIFGGVDFTPTFGMEAGYTNLREADHNFNIGATRYAGTTDGHRAYLAGKATMPVNEKVSVYGKLGAGYTKTELSTNAPGLGGSDSKTEVYAGVGGQYNISDRTALVLEYERYGKSKDIGAKADAITAGAKFSF